MPQAKTYGQLIDELLPQHSERRFRESWDLARNAIMQTHRARFASGPAAVNIKAKSADATWVVDGHRSTLQVDLSIAEFLLPHVEGSAPDGATENIRKPAESFLKIENGVVTDVILAYL